MSAEKLPGALCGRRLFALRRLDGLTEGAPVTTDFEGDSAADSIACDARPLR